MNLDFSVEVVGDSCLSFVFGKSIDKKLNRDILTIYKNIKTQGFSKDVPILDIIPTYKSLAFHFTPGIISISEIEEKLSNRIKLIALNLKSDNEDIKDVIIPVNYNGPDLKRVAKIHGISVKEVIALHTAPKYQVAMVGFRPHFPYLIGLDKRLETARLDSPRTKIPSGSVAIGGAQTGVYPEPSPGGWNIIGSSDPKYVKQIKPGDRLIFKELK